MDGENQKILLKWLSDLKRRHRQTMKNFYIVLPKKRNSELLLKKYRAMINALFLCSIVFGGEAYVELEEFAEGELLREVQLCGNLLDALVGLFQQDLRIVDGDGCDPLGRGLAGVFFHNAGEMAGGEVRLRGIETDASLGMVVLI